MCVEATGRYPTSLERSAADTFRWPLWRGIPGRGIRLHLRAVLYPLGVYDRLDPEVKAKVSNTTGREAPRTIHAILQSSISEFLVYKPNRTTHLGETYQHDNSSWVSKITYHCSQTWAFLYRLVRGHVGSIFQPVVGRAVDLVISKWVPFKPKEKLTKVSRSNRQTLNSVEICFYLLFMALEKVLKSDGRFH